MLTCSWTSHSGWSAPGITPYAPLTLSPLASALHYATECFEGMKAYRGHDGKLRLFRPRRNCERMLRSATRIALPAFEPSELQKLIEKFVGVEAARWLPDGQRGNHLYLRPTMIGTGDALGVQRPTEALFFMVAVCFPPLDEPDQAPPKPAINGPPTTTTPHSPSSRPLPSLAARPPAPPESTKPSGGMRLLASRHDTIRAWPGGFGNAKVGANYGPGLVAQQEARDQGYHQVLWLFGPECYLTEAGASNFFVVWRTRGGGGALQLVTAPLGDGVILEGVTRGSVLELVRERWAPGAGTGEGEGEPEMEVVERKFTMGEVVEAAAEGRLLEAFGCGTAFFIAPVADIHFRGKDVELPLKKGVEARYALTIKRWLREIMFGVVDHEWGVVVVEEEEET